MLTVSVLGPSAGEAAVLSITPSSSTVNAGDTVTIEIVAEDVANLGYIGFTLDFEATLLALDPAALVVGHFLMSAGASAMFPLFDASSDPDTIYMRMLLGGASTAAGVPQTVLSVTFVALASGVIPMVLADTMLLDTDNRHNYMIGERYDRPWR